MCSTVEFMLSQTPGCDRTLQFSPHHPGRLCRRTLSGPVLFRCCLPCAQQAGLWQQQGHILSSQIHRLARVCSSGLFQQSQHSYRGTCSAAEAARDLFSTVVAEIVVCDHLANHVLIKVVLVTRTLSSTSVPS